MVIPQLNDTLAALPPEEFRLFEPHLELVKLEKGENLFHPGETTLFVYFPVNAVVSMMNDMADGFSIETYMLGRASMVGLSHQGEVNFYRAQVRVPGWAYRMRISALLALKPHCPIYGKNNLAQARRAMMKFHHHLACIKHHSVEHQLIRWLLTNLELTDNPTIAITHQELAELLGYRREAITLAVGKLCVAGCLISHRGTLAIENSQCLKERACDCYWLALGQHRPPVVELDRHG